VLYDIVPKYDVESIHLFVMTYEIEQLSLAQLHQVAPTLTVALARSSMSRNELRAVDHQVATPALNSAGGCLS